MEALIQDDERSSLERDLTLLLEWRAQLRDELVVHPYDPALLAEEEMLVAALDRLEARSYTLAITRRSTA